MPGKDDNEVWHNSCRNRLKVSMMYCVKEETNFFTIHHGWRLICGKCEKQSWERRLRESALSLRLEVGSEMLPECWKHLQAANKHLTRKEPL